MHYVVSLSMALLFIHEFGDKLYDLFVPLEVEVVYPFDSNTVGSMLLLYIVAGIASLIACFLSHLHQKARACSFIESFLVHVGAMFMIYWAFAIIVRLSCFTVVEDVDVTSWAFNVGESNRIVANEIPVTMGVVVSILLLVLLRWRSQRVPSDAVRCEDSSIATSRPNGD